jgi:hypothetical protein
LASWILEPCLPKPGPCLAAFMTESGIRNVSELRSALIDRKKDMELRENLVWEAAESGEAIKRAEEFLEDLYLIASGSPPQNQGWVSTPQNGSPIYKATHIRK